MKAQQERSKNKFDPSVIVLNITSGTRVYDARTLREADVVQIKIYFACGHAAVKETTESTFALLCAGLGATAAHNW